MASGAAALTHLVFEKQPACHGWQVKMNFRWIAMWSAACRGRLTPTSTVWVNTEN